MKRRVALGAFGLIALIACSKPSALPPPASTSPSTSQRMVVRFSRVVVVVMENKEYGRIIGNADAPYINSLVDRYGLATSYFALGHPSLPNYLALLGGSTFGITSDCTQCHVDRENLVDQLEQSGISWKAYLEGLPSPCFTGAQAGEYVKRHEPFMYFDDIATDPARCSKVVPLSQLSDDLSTGRLPRFVWISPDLCHDMHDCSIAVGDRFLSTLLPPVLQALGPTGVLFLTWDEGTTDAGCCGAPAGGRVATIVAGPAARPGARSAEVYTHYSILRTIELSWALPSLGPAACGCARPMEALLESR